jgi:ribose transport system permease protein
VRSKQLARFAASGGAVWVVVAGLALYAAIASDDFRSVVNLTNLSRQMVVLGLASLAQFVVVLVRGVDLSLGASVRLAAIVAAIVMDGSNGRFVLGALAALALSMGIGAVNGLVAVWLRVEPFITTLGTGAVVSGLALYVASTPKGRASRWWTDFYTREIGPVPLLVVIAVAIGVMLWIMLARTAWGRHVYAVGGDPDVARVSGLHADRVALSAYVLAGLLAGITGVVVIGSTGVGDSSAAASLEFETLAVVVIGGTSLAGGRGRIIGVLGGIVLFGMLGNVFNLLNVEVWYQQLVRGAVILVAAGLYVQRRSARGPEPVATPPDSAIPTGRNWARGA